MINTRIHEITKELKETSEVSIKFFKTEFNNFVTRIEGLTLDLEKEVSTINKTIITVENSLKETRKEKKKTDEQIEVNKGKLDELDEREKKLKKGEENLAELHKVLENKRLMLDAQENELKTKTRRSVI